MIIEGIQGLLLGRNPREWQGQGYNEVIKKNVSSCSKQHPSLAQLNFNGSWENVKTSW